MEIVIISGTPGTGKTSVSMKIKEKINAKVISLNELAISNALTSKYDNIRKTYIIEEKKIINHVLKMLKQFEQQNCPLLIIESHFSDIIPNDLIDYPILLRCHPDELMRRLEKKNYNHEKIIENVQSEILGNSANYLIEKKMKTDIIEIDTTTLDIKSVAQLIVEIIQDNNTREVYSGLKVDWLELLFKEERLEDFF